MKQLKKTILTLVALLAVTTGAWAADTYTVTFAANGNTKTVENVTLPKNFQCSYSNADGELDLILKELYGWTGDSDETVCANWSTPTSSDANKVVAGKNGNDHYITIDNVFEGTVTITGDYYVDMELTQYSLEISIAAASSATPVDIAWDEAKKTGTFTMPGGNVTLEPEYYPQATVADGGVTAADADARATTDDPLVKVDATKLTGAKKLMYFVSNSGTTAPAYDAEGWTDQLPTAEGFTQQGIVYVWYYPVGTDEGVDGATATYSDGDICLQSITARIAPEPTYAVTFADDTAEPTLWKAEPATGVTKGETVTVTYSGSKKVIGVKAEKKEKAPALKTLANATAEDLGKIAGADGNIYDTKAAAEAAGTTAVAMIAYVGSDTGNDTYTHGMALALSDEGEMNWSNAKSTCEGKSAVSGAAWLLPSRNQWKAMFKANGGNEGSYTGLNTAVATAGGDSSKLQKNERYWSSSEQGSNFAWVLVLGEDNAGWDGAPEDLGHHVRACLAF